MIHLEGLWAENTRTVEGEILHRRADDASQTELRGDVLTLRALRVRSETLGLNGVCDLVEFHRDPNGVSLQGRAGKWQPYPVEYKRGEPKEGDEDEVQLCAQAICLEEMLQCTIPEGCLYYGQTRRRHRVTFTPELRGRVADIAHEIRAHTTRNHTPGAKRNKRCNACSLKDHCLQTLP